MAPDVLVEHFEWAGFGTCRIFCLGRWGWRWSWCSGLFGFYSNSCLQSCYFMLEIAISVGDSFEKIQEPLAEPKPWQCNAGGVADRLLVKGLSINQNLVVRDLVHRRAKKKIGKCQHPQLEGQHVSAATGLGHMIHNLLSWRAWRLILVCFLFMLRHSLLGFPPNLAFGIGKASMIWRLGLGGCRQTCVLLTKISRRPTFVCNYALPAPSGAWDRSSCLGPCWLDIFYSWSILSRSLLYRGFLSAYHGTILPHRSFNLDLRGLKAHDQKFEVLYSWGLSFSNRCLIKFATK